ncbi:MAG: hydrogenase formation protein HypD [Promethearchaeota archaeon]
MNKNSGNQVFKAGNFDLGKKILKKINQIAKKLKRKVQFMHICGTHEYTIQKNGVRGLLPEKIKIISGPGCPVCVCPTSDIDAAIELSRKPNVIITTFGDMLRVPASEMTLYEAKAKGGDIRIVYGPNDAVELAKKNPDKEVIFFSIGFETTAPLPAIEIFNQPPENFSIICANKLVPPAFDLLMQMEDIKIDGFILPGHVSVIIGSEVYLPFAQKYKSPMVVAGFEVNDVLFSLYLLVKQNLEGTYNIDNTYTRAVRSEGNVKALEYMNKVFEPRESMWRGIGKVPNSGLFLRKEYQQYDAVTKFNIKIRKEEKMPKGCLCTEVLMGKKIPKQCSLFGITCTPQHPIGPCMVSHEGTCKIAHMFGHLQK